MPLTLTQIQTITDYIAEVYNVTDTNSQIFDSHFRHVTRMIKVHIHRFGKDDQGNKPDDMDYIEYWVKNIPVNN